MFPEDIVDTVRFVACIMEIKNVERSLTSDIPPAFELSVVEYCSVSITVEQRAAKWQQTRQSRPQQTRVTSVTPNTVCCFLDCKPGILKGDHE